MPPATRSLVEPSTSSETLTSSISASFGGFAAGWFGLGFDESFWLGGRGGRLSALRRRRLGRGGSLGFASLAATGRGLLGGREPPMKREIWVEPIIHRKTIAKNRTSFFS